MHTWIIVLKVIINCTMNVMHALIIMHGVLYDCCNRCNNMHVQVHVNTTRYRTYRPVFKMFDV